MPVSVRLCHHARILQPILSTESGGAYKNFDKSELLKFWIEFDDLDQLKSSPDAHRLYAMMRRLQDFLNSDEKITRVNELCVWPQRH